jgi:hypothetical protein
LKYINHRAFHDKSNDSGGGSISSIYEALLAERGLIIAERLKKAVATPERYAQQPQIDVNMVLDTWKHFSDGAFDIFEWRRLGRAAVRRRTL